MHFKNIKFVVSTRKFSGKLSRMYQYQHQYPGALTQQQQFAPMVQAQAQHTLIYAAQCANCKRFMEMLDRTPVNAKVRRVDAYSLPPHQLAQVGSVPTLVTSTGQALVGTKAFEWLQQFNSVNELDCFDRGSGGLAFSDINDDLAPINYSTSYSAFEPVP
jgi:hypothetical protein